MYYQDGRRRVPTNVRLGETIFDEPVSVSSQQAKGTRSEEYSTLLPGQLSDSDESDGDEDSVPLPVSVDVPQGRKRERSPATEVDADLISLKQLRTSYTVTRRCYGVLTISLLYGNQTSRLLAAVP
ncbi:hypothetical protein F443_01248 [Phytophthora nicotianae P1569]|uniref:Uncharacterized protein n=1 Tax=Phytophthora nicotianae P1569 TaxID=1317065 RepID=V9FXF7_PHYNI|nr:hypothetical protein F443_01248 [Phytophthora nicotianae P1569]